MAELQTRVRERLRERVHQHGGSAILNDPVVFAGVEQLLRQATDVTDPAALVLPQLLGDPETWQMDIAMRYRSHRGGFAARVLMAVKRRVLMPPFRWLFEYSRDNFERQRHVNDVLFACVQELAAETIRLRHEVHRLSDPDHSSSSSSQTPR